jgi:TonB family protein
MDTTAILADREGRVVDGRYTLHRWLGGSPEGSVYLTEAAREGAVKAAIKLVPAASPGADARLAGWAAAFRIAHPRLLRVLHTGRCALDGSEVIYCVTELAEEVLVEILPDRPLTADETREMLAPILDALEALHGRGYVHGRLKPSNILVVADNLKLSADCSPVALAKTASPVVARGIYDAPELSRAVYSPAADVWSLGMTIVAALNQRSPAWDRESGFEPVVRPALVAPFESIVRDCLRLDPASRITLPEIRAQLEGKALPESAPLPSHPDFEPDFTPTPAPSARWAPAWITGAVLLGIAATAFFLHSRQSPAPSAAQESVPAAEQQAAVQPPAPAAVPPAQSGTPLPQDSAPATRSPSSEVNGAILKRVLPHVLPGALATIRGTVRIRVRVTVDSSGNVTDAVPLSPGASRYFTRAAVEAAQAWQFAPAPAGGQAAPRAWELHFDFRRNGVTATADRRTP